MIALAVAAIIIVPAALAWACNPQAYLKLDKAEYGPGERVGVSGAFFKENTQLTLSLEPGGTVGTVTTSGNGSFTTSFTAPSNAGSYTLSAVGFENGQVINGLPARASFSVGAAAPAERTESGAGPSQPGPAQPGASPGSRQGPRFAEPGAPRSEAFRGGRAQTERAAQRGADVAAGGGVVRSAGGGQVFAGSLPRGERASAASGGSFAPAAGARPAARGGRAEGRSGEQSAVGDVWGGFSSPSLLPRSTDGAPDGGTSSQLGWGIGLLALGLLTLVAGLAGAEVRRRRATVR